MDSGHLVLLTTATEALLYESISQTAFGNLEAFVSNMEAKYTKVLFFVCLASFLVKKKRCRVDMVIEYEAARDKIHECCEGGYKGWGDMEADHPL